MLNLGVRAHDFGKLPMEELASKIASHGLSCVQLAPTKAIAGFDADAGRLSPGFARQVARAFQRQHIEIAVLGCYINLSDRNLAHQRPQLQRFKEYLRFARDFGCSIVGTETGSVNSDFSPHPDNRGEEAYQIVLANVRELVAEAEKFGVFVCVEGVERYVISSPARLKRLVDDVNSPNLQVIFDPVNLLSAANYEAQDAIMAEMYELLAERICIVHAKDFTVTNGVFEELPAGRGKLHYASLLRWIKQHKPSVQVLLENTHPSTIEETVSFMRSAYQQA